MSKVGVKKLKQPVTLKGLEDELSLEAYLQYLDKGSDIGATLMKKPGKSEGYRVVFGFRCQGIPSVLSEEEIIGVLRGLESLDDFPPKETLTFHYQSSVEDQNRQAQLKRKMERVQSAPLRLLIGGVAQRTHQLTQMGVRKQNILSLWVTYTVEENVEGQKTDVFEEILGKVEKWWHKTNGSYEEVQQMALKTILLEAYNLGFQRYQRLLGNQMGLTLQPMTSNEIKTYCWQRLNLNLKSSPPHRLATITIKVSEKQFSETIPDIHPKSYLLSDNVAVAERSYIKHQENYTGVLLLADKPDVPDDEPISQLFYLWETLLSRESIYDIEVITQIRRRDSKILKDKMSTLTRQSQKSAQEASEKGEIDVGANLAVEDAIEAQVSLHRAGEPFYTGTVILVHRPNLYELQQTCANIMSYFRRSGWVVREEEYAWRLWLETMPMLQWPKLLARPFNRQKTYLREEISRILPLIANRSLAQDGFELIASEGGTPIFLPIYQKCFHTAIFAASGSGKSVLFSDIIAQALEHEMPVTLLEFPRSDGTGSFDGLCQYLPEYCSYIDIGKKESGMNLLEPPDLRGLNADLKEERFTDAKEEILGILLAMILGFSDESSKQMTVNPETTRSLLRLMLLTFYEDPEIRERFARAFQQGFGSKEWESMPILEDFLGFASLERLRLTSDDPQTLQTLNFIKLRLRDWLDSRLGKFLNRPTRFASDRLVQVISLRGLNNDTDAMIMGSLAYLSAFRRSLQYEDSIFGIDEAPILLAYDAIAQRIGEMAANGRKSGIRLILAAQGLGSVLKCAAADKILDNLAVKLVGKVHPQSIEQYVEVLKYPYDLVVENASEKYGINVQDNYTRWLYDDGRLIPVRHYPSQPLLALVGNSRLEAQMRQEFWQNCRIDPIQGLIQLTKRFEQIGGNREKTSNPQM